MLRENVIDLKLVLLDLGKKLGERRINSNAIVDYLVSVTRDVEMMMIHRIHQIKRAFPRIGGKIGGGEATFYGFRRIKRRWNGRKLHLLRLISAEILYGRP